jgi:hypothetical protein
MELQIYKYLDLIYVVDLDKNTILENGDKVYNADLV